MLFTDELDTDTVTLKFAALTEGDSLGTPVVVQEKIDRLYALSSNHDVVYTINRRSPGLDGLYIATGLPFSP